jgi:hypothetical protein
VLHYRINLQGLEACLASYYRFNAQEEADTNPDFEETGKSRNLKDLDFKETWSSYYIKDKESKAKESSADADGDPELGYLLKATSHALGREPTEPEKAKLRKAYDKHGYEAMLRLYDTDTPAKSLTAILKPLKPPPEPRKSDPLWEAICIGSFGKPYTQIEEAQQKRVGVIKRDLLKQRPDLTPAELEAAYQHYEAKNPDIEQSPDQRLKSYITILDWIQQAIDAGKVKQSARTPDEIRAGFSPLQKTYAEQYPDETPGRIEAMSESVLIAGLDMKGVAV